MEQFKVGSIVPRNGVRCRIKGATTINNKLCYTVVGLDGQDLPGVHYLQHNAIMEELQTMARYAVGDPVATTLRYGNHHVMERKWNCRTGQINYRIAKHAYDEEAVWATEAQLIPLPPRAPEPPAGLDVYGRGVKPQTQ